MYSSWMYRHKPLSLHLKFCNEFMISLANHLYYHPLHLYYTSFTSHMTSFFPSQTIRDWNQLPIPIIESKDYNTFSTEIANYLNMLAY